jgi:dephospho-CoA kinase
MKPLLVALTGNIGVGKSTVAKFLTEHGADVVSGDELGRLALEKSPENLAAVRWRFGPEIFNPDGILNRRVLGQRVFASRDDAAWLTHLTFPAIYEGWRKAVKQSPAKVIVFDAALIFEWGIERDFDVVILVAAAQSAVLNRLTGERHLSPAEGDARRSAQLDEAAKIEKADVVVQNDGTIPDLCARVDQIWQTLIEPRFQKGIS